LHQRLHTINSLHASIIKAIMLNVSRIIFIAIIRCPFSDAPTVLAAHLVANMTEYICLLDFLNLFLLLGGTPGELHVRLSKHRSHLVPPYRASPPRLLPGGLPAHQLLQAHLLVHLVQEILHGIFRISPKVLFVDTPPAVQKRPRQRGHPTHVVGV
jgi:hypothetical protein